MTEAMTLTEALAPYRPATDLTGDAMTPRPAAKLTAPVEKALAGEGWFLASLWYEYRGNDRVLVVDIEEEAIATEEEANEAERERQRFAGDFFLEVLDGFSLTCPSDAALAAVPADDRERLTRYRNGMIEVLDGADRPSD